MWPAYGIHTGSNAARSDVGRRVAQRWLAGSTRSERISCGTARCGRAWGSAGIRQPQGIQGIHCGKITMWASVCEETPVGFWHGRLVLDGRPQRDGRRERARRRRGVLVEIGPEGGRRHNSPLKVLPPPKGKAAEGPPRRKAEKLSYLRYLY
jgi:hypothetical protein